MTGAYEETVGSIPTDREKLVGKAGIDRVREVLDKAIPAPTDTVCEICSHELKYHARGRCFHPDETGVDCGCETPQRGDR
jgi:hypothetical protein